LWEEKNNVLGVNVQRHIDTYSRCIYNGFMKTVINIKTDPETKKRAQELAEELGVPLSTIINVYLRQFIRTREFSFSLAYPMSPALEKILAEAETDMAANENLSPTFHNANDALTWLEKDGHESPFS